jgi:hypothetical protein
VGGFVKIVGIQDLENVDERAVVDQDGAEDRFFRLNALGWKFMECWGLDAGCKVSGIKNDFWIGNREPRAMLARKLPAIGYGSRRFFRNHFHGDFRFDALVYADRNLEGADGFNRFVEQHHTFFNLDVLFFQGVDNIPNRHGTIKLIRLVNLGGNGDGNGFQAGGHLLGKLFFLGNLQFEFGLFLLKNLALLGVAGTALPWGSR